MPALIPIQYRGFHYPNNIILHIQEIAGHFDVVAINPSKEYSLHTEYAYGKRKYSSDLIKSHSIIKESTKNNIPQLWKNEQWSKDFSGFVIELIGKNNPPKIIEIHPPFTDYCESIERFVDLYSIFEFEILKIFKNVKIFIENRSGSIYNGGKFLISKNQHLVKLADVIVKNILQLRIVIDFPQLLTAHDVDTYNTSNEIIYEIFEPLHQIKNMIEGVHIWGKKKNIKGRVVAHQGNLNSLFTNKDLKRYFLKLIYDLFDDGKYRYFVPEVNSGAQDVESIVNDFIQDGFTFVSNNTDLI